MTDPGRAIFEPTLQKTDQVLKDIGAAYGWPDDRARQSYDALREVLHALRDRLTVVEANDLAAQLPMLVRGLYFEGWRPERAPVKMDRAEFLTRIDEGLDFEVEGGPEPLVHNVLTALSRFVTPGEWDDVRSTLPKDLAGLVPAAA